MVNYIFITKVSGSTTTLARVSESGIVKQEKVYTNKKIYGLTWDGTYLWGCGRNGSSDAFFKINHTTLAILEYWNVDTWENFQACAWNGSTLFVGNTADNQIEKWYYNGIDFTFSEEFPNGDITGLTFDGTNFWSTTETKIRKHNNDSTMSISAQYDTADSNTTGIWWDGTTFWTSGKTTSKIFKHNSADIETVDSSFGYPIPQDVVYIEYTATLGLSLNSDAVTGESYDVKATLHDGFKFIEGKDISITEGDNTYVKTTNENGIATLSDLKNNAGNYEYGASITYDGELLTATPKTIIITFDDSWFKIDNVNFALMPLGDVIYDMSKLVNYCYYVDADKSLHFFENKKYHSNITLDKRDIYSLRINTDVMDLKNKIYVVGGAEIIEEHSIIPGNNYVDNYKKNYAIKFKANRTNYKQIGIWISKVGEPPSLEVDIVQDENNAPSETVLGSYTFDTDTISDKACYYADINSDISGDCWLVFNALTYDDGASGSDNYRIYKDVGNTQTLGYKYYTASSWTVSDGDAYGFVLTYGQDIAVTAQDDDSIIDYGLREKVIEDTTIITKESAQLRADGELAISIKLPQDIILKTKYYPRYEVGKTVTLFLPNIGIVGDYLINQIDIIFGHGKSAVYCTLTLNTVKPLFTDVVADYFSQVRREKTKDYQINL